MAELKTEDSVPLFLPIDNEEDVVLRSEIRKSSPVGVECGLSQEGRAKDQFQVSDATMHDSDAFRASSPPSSSFSRENRSNSKVSKPGPSKSSQTSGTSSQDRHRKKRKVEHTPHPAFPKRKGYYLGSILVGNAWSTVRGTGYIKSGDPVFVERETLQEDAGNGGKDQKKKAKGKQVTLNSMFKPQTKSELAKKPKPNTVVRLTNARGFGGFKFIHELLDLFLNNLPLEFGRLPTDVSNWVSKLMDFGD